MLMPHKTQFNDSVAETTGSEGRSPYVLSASATTWTLRLLFAYFGIRLVFYAIKIAPFLPPDEITHAGLCCVFSDAFLLPSNSPQTYQFGLATNIPWLYYWVMGKLLHLNPASIPALLFLRLLNIPLALGTVWYTLRLLRLLTDNRLIHILLLAVITNISMFSLLSASVSYDNLTNLLAAMSIYYLVAFLKHRSGNLLAASLLCQLAGGLTKTAFLPLVPALGIAFLAHEFRNLRGSTSAVTTYFRTKSFWPLCLTAIILVAFGLNLQLYAGNYLRYKTLTPSMADVISQEAAMQYRIGARETIFRLYTEGKMSYIDALMKASDIKHQGDRADTLFLLTNYEKMKEKPELWMNLPQYVIFWGQNMVGSMIGIKAHLQMFKDPAYAIPLFLLMAMALVGFGLRWRPQVENGWLVLLLAGTACFYSCYLMYQVNYKAYLYYGAPGITLQGRYLFPVLAPLSILFSNYLIVLFPKNSHRLLLTVVVATLFVFYDFPYFLTHVTPEWYKGFGAR